ncbi:bifunctional methylenetetrahydrofolate dehydrogenase/methenyltetrahydrofolate cyclohydrolase FolD [Psychrobacter frigidicola]|uniref:Bifunctional protein FolD n=1 Tax=Psychrobacter frigidicola TaxID=45611 RepID=A0A5C7A5V9_9GAMM|nr:bifunctional methylenetetrahydrofolate dehydrogenase/methenyltetrahydrofolate cyclohydrolase FolD [Psychrobacter frigidicola]TXD98578.1 bifunctional methylenetetrahydrofolate dehydrogenase/methenyltetrahydrofolate cyclohydrolase FolD [Psychrobacter frigidicola]
MEEDKPSSDPKSAIVMDGKVLAKQIEENLRVRVDAIKEKTGRTPILATILVGDDPASATYVRMKSNACKRVGMDSMKVELPSVTTTEQLLAKIDELNDNQDVHGILLQHPVPAHIDERACFEQIDLEKDVDGVTCLGFGRMSMGEPAFGSCTPQGVMHLLRHYNIELAGKEAVVVGRSPILGKPMAMMLLNANCTVTMCHSHTEDLAAYVKRADIIVGAVGVPELIRTEWIKKGAVVIDAGFHPSENGGVGDTQRDGMKEVAGAYTPVPGGVGPMTINTLIRQTVAAAEKSAGLDASMIS